MSAPSANPLDPKSPRTRRLDLLAEGSASTRGDKTEIGWTHAKGYVGRTWNPVTGCHKVSPGCKHCYAETFAERFRGVLQPNGKPHVFHGGFDPTLRAERIDEPRSWRSPQMVFVNSMSDLFGDFVPDDFLDKAFDVMRSTPQHVYQVLTKRAERLVKYTGKNPWLADATHIWLGVSVEDKKYGLPRVDLLRRASASVRFLSIEPLLESLGAFDVAGIDWVILGGESGPKARAMHPDWAREVRDVAKAAGVPFFFKQWGEFDAHGVRKHKKGSGRELDGRTWDEFPCGLAAGSETALLCREPSPTTGEGELDGQEQAGLPTDATRDENRALASYDPTRPLVSSSEAPTPTTDQYERFQFLHRYFNEKLGLQVGPAMLAFSRKAKAFGYFAAERWRKDSDEDARVSEIALNPDCLSHEPREVASTIVHEMVHQWQHEHGQRKSRRAYHDKEWGSKMEAIGLMPSSTGAPGGKKTGAKMSDYVIEGGAFAKAFAELPPGALLPFVSGTPVVGGGSVPPKPPKPKDPSKTPFVCGGGCKSRMWGKPSLSAVCKTCGVDFVPCGTATNGVPSSAGANNE